MSDLREFLEVTVPRTLQKVSTNYTFIVVGTRALNAYLAGVHINPLVTRDWDVLVIGPQEKQEAMAQKVYDDIEAQGFPVGIEYYDADGSPAEEPFALRSRPWIRLTVSLGGEADVAFLDVYQFHDWVTGIGLAIEKNGLLYSDLGFLVRELNRDEKSAQKLLAGARSIPVRGVEAKTDSLNTALHDTGIDLDVLEDESDELVEQIGQISDGEVRKKLSSQLARLEQAKKSLIRISAEREALFGLVASGRLNKAQTERICAVCRLLEQQHDMYTTLKTKCENIKKQC